MFPLLLVSLILGCIGGAQTGNDTREPEILLDAAMAKIEVGDQYLIEKNEDMATEVLLDAKKDIELLLLQLNSTVYKEALNQVENASVGVSDALESLDKGDLPAARSRLYDAKEELLKAGVLFLGRKDLGAPTRFKTELKEIPLTYYGYVDGVYIGYQVVPHNVAESAREAFYSYKKTRSEKDLNRGVLLADYLISTSTVRGNGSFVVWENSFPWPAYNLQRGWIGSLSQAGCMKALMLAYEATGEKMYLDFAEKALKAFLVDVSDGGLRITRTYNNEKYVWYPEYAKEAPPFVLNGFITVVIWLNDYYTFTGNLKAKALYDDGLKSIIHFLPSYEYGRNWSYYDAVGHVSNNHYHELHVKQMSILYELSGEEIFNEYRDKWSG